MGCNCRGMLRINPETGRVYYLEGCDWIEISLFALGSQSVSLAANAKEAQQAMGIDPPTPDEVAAGSTNDSACAKATACAEILAGVLEALLWTAKETSGLGLQIGSLAASNRWKKQYPEYPLSKSAKLGDIIADFKADFDEEAEWAARDATKSAALAELTCYLLSRFDKYPRLTDADIAVITSGNLPTGSSPLNALFNRAVKIVSTSVYHEPAQAAIKAGISDCDCYGEGTGNGNPPPVVDPDTPPSGFARFKVHSFVNAIPQNMHGWEVSAMIGSTPARGSGDGYTVAGSYSHGEQYNQDFSQIGAILDIGAVMSYLKSFLLFYNVSPAASQVFAYLHGAESLATTWRQFGGLYTLGSGTGGSIQWIENAIPNVRYLLLTVGAQKDASNNPLFSLSINQIRLTAEYGTDRVITLPSNWKLTL